MPEEKIAKEKKADVIVDVRKMVAEKKVRCLLLVLITLASQVKSRRLYKTRVSLLYSSCPK